MQRSEAAARPLQTHDFVVICPKQAIIMRYTRYCRSVLVTPATAVDKYEKAHRAGADICLVDLEDAVPPWDKEKGRLLAETFFSAPSAAACRCAVRINAITEADGLADLLKIMEYETKPAIVLIPKVETARDIQIADHVLGASCPDVEFFAVVETPLGLERATKIAHASPRLRGLIFGAADYSLTVGARLDWDSLAMARARLLNSARAAGIEAVDTPSFELGDLDLLRRESGLARDMGYGGKIAIHPRQVPVLNQAFSPDRATLETARRVVAASRESGLNITVVDGAMVGAPFFQASQRLLEEFGDDQVAGGNP
jgi:(S)-citramalyl-CoA lyase